MHLYILGNSYFYYWLTFLWLLSDYVHCMYMHVMNVPEWFKGLSILRLSLKHPCALIMMFNYSFCDFSYDRETTSDFVYEPLVTVHVLTCRYKCYQQSNNFWYIFNFVTHIASLEKKKVRRNFKLYLFIKYCLV